MSTASCVFDQRHEPVKLIVQSRLATNQTAIELSSVSDAGRRIRHPLQRLEHKECRLYSTHYTAL